jgi:hypothetical protein
VIMRSTSSTYPLVFGDAEIRAPEGAVTL